MPTTNRIDPEKYLAGDIDLPKNFNFDQYEVSKDAAALTHALINRPFDEAEAARWYAFLKEIKSDFQACAHLRDVFILRNRGDIPTEWTTYVFDGTKRHFMFTHFDTIADRLRNYGGGLGEATIKKILNI